MSGRSIVGQKTLLQAEVTHGTPLVNAMKQISGLRMRPGFSGEADPFKGISGKVATTVILPDLSGDWEVDAVQCYNALGYVAASRIATPVITTPGGGTDSRQAVFTLSPNAADAFTSYTAQFGDTTQAVQANYGVFQSFGLHIQRGQLEFTTDFMSREPATGATLASSGVTTVPAVPISPISYDVYADDDWADLGTTKLLACYQMNVDLGDKYEADSPINSAVSSYESAMEAEDQDYGFDAIFGFDSTAVSLITSNFKVGALKFFRVHVLGPVIESTIHYELTFDFAAFITSVGQLDKAPNSPAITVPMTLQLGQDDSGNACELTLVNTQAAY